MNEPRLKPNYTESRTLPRGCPCGCQVEAQRHTNPDGTLGGWVALTAYVSPKSYVGASVRIFDFARVLGKSRIDGEAVIQNFAEVLDSQILGKVRVSDRALVEGSKIEGDISIKDRSYVKASQILGTGAVGIRGAVLDSIIVSESFRLLGSVTNVNALTTYLHIDCRAHVQATAINGDRFMFQGFSDTQYSSFTGGPIQVTGRCQLWQVVVNGASILIEGQCVVDRGTVIQEDGLTITGDRWPLPPPPPPEVPAPPPPPEVPEAIEVAVPASEEPVGIPALIALLNSDFE